MSARRRRRLPGRPAGADAEATRRTLLEAALAAFAERGYEGMSVRELARQVGVSHNLVHHYYGSKWDLWRAALGHGLAASGREVLALIEDNRNEGDWEVAHHEGVRGAVHLFARSPAVAKILADESARGGARLDFLFERCIEPFLRLFEGLVAGIPAREARRLDARAAMLFLFAGMVAPFTLGGLAAKLGGPEASSERELERFAETVADLLAHGLAPAGAGGRGSAKRVEPRVAARARRRAATQARVRLRGGSRVVGSTS